MSRIERKYCLVSTSCLTVLFDISILLLDFGVFWGTFIMRTLNVMPVMRNAHLVSIQSWTYLCVRARTMHGLECFCYNEFWIYLHIIMLAF